MASSRPRPTNLTPRPAQNFRRRRQGEAADPMGDSLGGGGLVDVDGEAVGDGDARFGQGGDG